MYIVPKQKWRYPMAIEREYAKDLVHYVEAEMKIVESFLPEIVEAVWRNRLQKDGFNDDGLGDWLGGLVKKVENKIAKVLSPVKAIEKTFAKVAKHVKEQFGGIFKSVFGAKPKAVKGEAVKLETMKNLWVNENLDLIKSVDRNVLDSVRRTLTEKVVAAADKNILMSDLTAEIERLTGVSRTRAALIGADQVGKLHGRLAEYKQKNQGCERYRWATMRDSRVRIKHRARDGKIFSWDDPPDGGHPGQAIRCRCIAEPVFDTDKNLLSPQRNTFIKLPDDGIIKPDKIISRNESIPRMFKPHGIIDSVGETGHIYRTFYGSDGIMVRQIHSDDHGNPKQHPYGEHGEHKHDYVWSKDGKKQIQRKVDELNEQERKENGDLLWWQQKN